ncbi:hypothetical protein Fmac_008492 [Flemingia macrophylla]|uniref:Uncharacterized protein n=1 Tax=Flemingia macrophylla TaxID=520843 RepID=A0ABD1MXJ3_9FABA
MKGVRRAEPFTHYRASSRKRSKQPLKNNRTLVLANRHLKPQASYVELKPFPKTNSSKDICLHRGKEAHKCVSMGGHLTYQKLLLKM